MQGVKREGAPNPTKRIAEPSEMLFLPTMFAICYKRTAALAFLLGMCPLKLWDLASAF